MQKVLLVDDVKLFLELEKAILNRKNLQVFTATSGQEAIDIHRREKVDLILCDLYMPGMNGDETCRVIRSDEALKNVFIIIVTTSASVEDIDRCMKGGANDYIAKPIKPTELLEKLNTYINVTMRTSSPRVFVRLGVEGATENNSELFTGTTRNISSTGVLIETGRTFSIGETASFSFAMPDMASRVYVKGTVVRKADSYLPKMNHYGIHFLDIKQEDKLAIEDYVKSHPEAVI